MRGILRRNVIAALLFASGLALAGSAALSLYPQRSSAAGPLIETLPNTSGDGHPVYRQHQSPVRPAPAGPDEVIAVLTISRLGITGAPIYDRGVDPKGSMLIAHGYAVTHYAYSAAIGVGNAVLFGHDDIDGSVFARLKDLRPGDEIDVRMAGEVQVYRVSDRRIVPPTAVQILDPTPDVRLTLFTCWPNWVDTQRVVIIATAAPAS
jgi:LPXTG-site transpeptidase (sortase) family protein